MSATELKSIIMNKLASISDLQLLEELNKILNLADNSETINLSKEQKEKIEIAQKEYLEGKYLSNTQAEKDIEECLK
ncbi:MAG: hypothetical protein ACPGR5_05880 [Chitinophagales bacterium]